MLQAKCPTAASAAGFFLFSLVPSNRTRGGWQPQGWVGPLFPFLAKEETGGGSGLN